ncbi:MAG: BrnT family toxin [Nitrospirae bacterium]|nr:BrnT family toxin [Nitrospirota bacterium]MDA1304446.1 BrnT family toxin [Nitrospirota bacterium]
MFTWDIQKAIINFEKHGVPFEEAATVFSDPDGLDWEDLKHSQQEKRSRRLGQSIQGRILLVVYTIRRTEHGKETIRIIGARQASRKERAAYSRPEA